MLGNFAGIVTSEATLGIESLARLVRIVILSETFQDRLEGDLGIAACDLVNVSHGPELAGFVGTGVALGSASREHMHTYLCLGGE